MYHKILLNDLELSDDVDIDGFDTDNFSLHKRTLYQDITVNPKFIQSVHSISFQFNPYSGLVEFDLGATQNPSIRVMNSTGQVIHSQVDISSADYTLKSPHFFEYVDSYTDKAKQGFSFLC